MKIVTIISSQHPELGTDGHRHTKKRAFFLNETVLSAFALNPTL